MKKKMKPEMILIPKPKPFPKMHHFILDLENRNHSFNVLTVNKSYQNNHNNRYLLLWDILLHWDTKIREGKYSEQEGGADPSST